MTVQSHQPLTTVLRSIANWSWLIALTVLAVGGLIFIGTRTEAVGDNTAVGRVGLSTNAEWPRHSATLDAFESGVIDPARVEAVETELGTGRLVVEAAEIDGTFVVEVMVEASDADTAAAAADRLMELTIVEQGLASEAVAQAEIVAFTERIETLTIEAAASERELADVDRQLLAASDQLEVDFDFTVDDERRALLGDRQIVEGRIEDLQMEIRSNDNQRFDREVELAGPSNELLVTTPARAATAAPVTSTLTASIAAAVFAALIASVLAVWFDRERGPLRSAWQSEELLGVPVVAQLQKGKVAEADGNSRLSNAIAIAAGQRIVGLWWNNATNHNELTAALASTIEADYPNLVVENGECPVIGLTDHRQHPTSVVDLGTRSGDAIGLPKRAFHCDGVILSARRNRTSMLTLRAQLDELNRADLPVLGLVMVE